jgi:hypothetical protein
VVIIEPVWSRFGSELAKLVPIAWDLVPIENEACWTWFIGHLKHCISISESEDYIFISDREKGIATALPAVFDKSIHLHCCQHIADNLQRRYGNRVRPLFWNACRAKTHQLSAEKMEELRAQNQPALTISLGVFLRQSRDLT